MTSDRKKSVTEIGQITINYSNLEFTIQSLIWLLIGCDTKKGQAITTGLNFNILLKMLLALSENSKLTVNIKTSIRKTAFNIEKVCEKRNTLIHSTILLSDDGNIGAFRYTNKGPKGIKNNSKIHSFIDLENISNEIFSLSNELAKLHGQIVNSNIQL